MRYLLFPLALGLALAGLPGTSHADSIDSSPVMELRDEGVNQGGVKKIDCTGTGVTCSRSGVIGTINVSGGGGGAPTDATYVTTTANGTLTNEVVIGVVDDTTFVGNGTTIEAKVLPSCSNGTTEKLLYNAGTNSFSCGTDQGGAGSGLDHQAVMARVSLGF